MSSDLRVQLLNIVKDPNIKKTLSEFTKEERGLLFRYIHNVALYEAELKPLSTRIDAISKKDPTVMRKLKDQDKGDFWLVIEKHFKGKEFKDPFTEERFLLLYHLSLLKFHYPDQSWSQIIQGNDVKRSVHYVVDMISKQDDVQKKLQGKG